MKQCKGCGRDIIWATTESGRKIPLDASAPVFEIDHSEGITVAKRLPGVHVSHLDICSEAAQLSDKSKKENLQNEFNLARQL